MARYLMLDVDGVLVTGRPSDGRPWYAELQNDLGIDIEWLRSDFFSVFWPEILVGGMDLLPTLQTCLDQANIDTPARRVVDYWFAMDSKVNQEILAQCEALRTAKIPVYLATNQDHLRANYLMNDLNLSAHVDGIFYSAQLGAAKPHPDFYQYITDRLGASPTEMFLVDDTPKNIIAAQQAGWEAHHWQGTQPFAGVIDGKF
jgi:putative hydrolase of the HAD superfamily